MADMVQYRRNSASQRAYRRAGQRYDVTRLSDGEYRIRIDGQATPVDVQAGSCDDALTKYLRGREA